VRRTRALSIQRLEGSDLRAWHRLWTDDGALGNNPFPLRLFFPKLTKYSVLADLVARHYLFGFAGFARCFDGLGELYAPLLLMNSSL